MGRLLYYICLFFKSRGSLSQAWLDAYDSSMYTTSLPSIGQQNCSNHHLANIIKLTLLQRDQVIPGPKRFSDVLSQGFTAYPAKLLGWRMSSVYPRYIKTPTHSLTKLSKQFVSTSKASIQLYPATFLRHKTLNTPWLRIHLHSYLINI